MKLSNIKLTVLLSILLVTLLAGFLRFSNLGNNPPGLTVDEVSTGYNAYSILKTGKDEYGNFLPLTFKSLGDYKPPLYIYLTAIVVFLFGLSESSIRLPSALIGTLTIPIAYFLFKEITKSKKIALIGAILLAISPWHIYYSRVAFESPVALTWVMLGMLGFLKMFQKGIFWAITSAFFFCLSMYTYHSERLFVPLLILTLLILYHRELVKAKKTIIFFLVTFLILIIPLTVNFIFGTGGARVQMTLITNDPYFIRNFATQTISKNGWTSNILSNTFGSNSLILVFFVLRKILSFFQPTFLFFNGLNMTTSGSYSLGVMNIFELPFLVLGLIKLIQKNINKVLILGWIILGLIPAAITQDELNPIRTLIISPMLVLISAIGVVAFLDLIRSYRPSLRWGLIISLFIFIAWNLVYNFLVFSVHFPIEKNEDFLYGTKQTIQFALASKQNFQEIVFDPNRGTAGPFIVSVPHVYLLFYAKYDPATYLALPKRVGENSYGFDKFTIRRIDWRTDQTKKGVLFIGSPWDFQDFNLKEDEILAKFYLLSGQLAFMAVTPKP